MRFDISVVPTEIADQLVVSIFRFRIDGKRDLGFAEMVVEQVPQQTRHVQTRIYDFLVLIRSEHDVDAFQVFLFWLFHTPRMPDLHTDVKYLIYDVYYY